MAAATAYCTSNTNFHQHSLPTTRSQYTPIPCRTTLSPSASFSSTAPISHNEPLSSIKKIKSDENNNDHEIEDTTSSDTDGMLYITSDDEVNDDDQVVDNIDVEQFLSFVRLRSKFKKPIVRNLPLPPLTKRLACPVCLLPIPKFNERVRQALYIRSRYLKNLPITSDIESFCSTDDNARAQSLLPRSVVQTRALSTLNKTPKKQKLPKTEFLRMAASTFRHNTSKMTRYVHSILQCNVILDRLEQSTIDQIMQDSPEDDDKIISTESTSNQSLNKTSPETRRSFSISNNETTKIPIITVIKARENPTIKRKTTTATEISKSKRFKSVNNNPDNINDTDTKNNSSSSTYKRIYLKCYVCSKHQYINAQAKNSDVLHSHWVQHDGDLSLNIYDSEIDSILTRVVEFFNLPKQHTLEGKIKTVFIYNSKEIRSTSATNLCANDSCIVID